MTLGAILSEFIVVRIFVTICAFGCLNTFELLEFLPVPGAGFMTLNAGNMFMFTGQLEFRGLMIEL